MRTKGDWPERVSFLQGFGLGFARLWNDDLPAAAVRIDRGSVGFLRDCLAELPKLDSALSVAYSPPLTESTSRMWLKAGFELDRRLDVFNREIGHVIANPTTKIVTGDLENLDEVIAIDAGAFETFWRFGRPGIVDAMRSTPNNVLLLSMVGTDVAGFAIMGMAGQKSYLQRIGVAGQHRAKGHGSSLVRAGLQWASKKGAVSVVLNTQPDNATAQALYSNEGFDHHPRTLQLLKKAL